MQHKRIITGIVLGALIIGAVAAIFAVRLAETVERNIQRELREWFAVKSVNDLGSNDGTIDIFVTPENTLAATATYAAQVGSLDQGAVTTGSLGIQNHAATTTGTILIDDFVQDDVRIFPNERFPTTFTVTQNAHLFVGPGSIDAAALMTTGGSEILTLWDTDRANVDATQSFRVQLTDGVQTAFTGPLTFQKGCYAVISGTNARAHVILTEASDRPGVLGPKTLSP